MPNRTRELPGEQTDDTESAVNAAETSGEQEGSPAPPGRGANYTEPDIAPEPPRRGDVEREAEPPSRDEKKGPKQE
jgi:hypothetical protein